MKYNRITTINLALLFSLILLLGSCDNFLEEVPTANLSDKSTYKTQADVDALTVGPYRSLPNWLSGGGDWGNQLPNSVEFVTGFAWTAEPHAQFWKYETNQVSGDLLDNYNNQWVYWWQGVRDANFSIAQLNKVTSVATANVQKALGEVRTLRAWYYFCLVRYFGDVPMVTEPLASISEAEQPRTSLKKIYDEVIIPDLEFAVNQSTLVDTKSTDGRITKYTARAILADVYLTCAGYPYQEVATNATKNWCVEGGWTMATYPVASGKSFLEKAKTQLDVLYGKYTLGTYKDLRDPAKNNTGEAIFQAQFLSTISNNGIIQCCFPLTSHISMFGDENGTFIPSMGYYNSYNDNDLRKQERQFFFTSDKVSDKYAEKGNLVKFDRPYLYKYYDELAVKGAAPAGGASGLNWTFYRYADILLMLTEVNWTLKQLGVSVSDNDITKGINEVRARALMPAYNASDVNLFSIMSERAYELVFENKMIWDQRRTRMCLTPGVGSFGTIHSFFGHRPESFSFNFSAMNLLCPMPGNEIKTNKKLLQNFGYLPKQVGQ